MFSLLGSLASGKISDHIGRCYTIVLAACTFLIGALLMALATSYLFFMVGHAVAGISVGYALMIAPGLQRKALTYHEPRLPHLAR